MLPGMYDSDLNLRPYQEGIIGAWFAAADRGIQRGLVVAATGTGKTVTFAALAGRILGEDASRTLLILAHRKELLEQTYETCGWAIPGIDVSIHSGDCKAKKGSQIVIASVQSLGSREPHSVLEWLQPSTVICDESHHACASTYQNVFRNAGCYQEDGCQLIGFTATPHRLDNQALVGKSTKAIFEEVVYRFGIVNAIREGWLVDLIGFRAAADLNLDDVKVVHGDYQQNELERAVNTDPINELAFKSWAECAADRQTIVFCAGVEHAKSVAAVFRSQGVTAEAIWGDMSRPDREAAIRRFREGKTQVLTNMDILTEGFDARECAAVLLLRPTKSWSLFTQMVGRGLRPLPGVVESGETSEARRAAIAASRKPNCVVIDIVGNVAAHDITAKKTGTGSPSIQALVGLPEGLDLEGKGVSEAVELFDELPEAVKASAFAKRNTTFRGLSAVLTQVSLISEIAVADEAKDSGAEFYWMKTGEYEYSLDCGTSNSVRREARLTCDMLGNWEVIYECAPIDGSPPRRECLALTGEHAFKQAESFVRRTMIGGSASTLLDANARWRTAPPTDAQLRALRARGVDEAILGGLDRGHASAMLTHLQRAQQRAA